MLVLAAALEDGGDAEDGTTAIAVFMPAVAAGRNRTGEDDIYYVSEEAWATDLTVTHRQELC